MLHPLLFPVAAEAANGGQPAIPVQDPNTGCEALQDQLEPFTPIRLAEMKRVALFDRVEVKYLMHLETLLHALARLPHAYRVLEIEGRRINHYRTLYFDTQDFALYRSHHARVRNRYKVRVREYVDTHCSFLEVKHRINKRRTVKSRIPVPALLTRFEGESAVFLHSHCPYPADELLPTLWNTYTRVTLVSPTAAERLTLDTSLAFAWQERHARLPGIVVAEVKQAPHVRGSAFVALMRDLHIRRTGFSKYCIGASLLYPGLKHNRFKPIHHRLAVLAQAGRGQPCL
jgi:hypothetical protein